MYKKTILVTGATGFIGLHLVPALLRNGYSVRAVTRGEQVLPGSEVIKVVDLVNIDWLNLLQGVDAVIHLAGVAHTRKVDPILLKRFNTDISVSLAQALGPTQKLIYFSSIRAQVGAWSPHEVLDDATPYPEDAYGRSKLDAECLLSAIRPDACILRPVSVYGPGCKLNLKVLERIGRSSLPVPFGAFTAKRSYISIENILSAVLFSLAADLCGTFIASDPDPLTLHDIVAFFRKGLGRRAMLFPVPPHLLIQFGKLVGVADAVKLASSPLVARPDKLVRAGWKPAVSSQQGVSNWAQNLPSHDFCN